MKKNILLLGTYYEQSHGDALLFDCVKKIYKDLEKKYNLELNVEFVDINGKNSINYFENNKSNFQNLKKEIKKLYIYNFLKKIRSYYYTKKELKFLKKFYNSKLKNADLIVIVGGGLFKYNVRKNYVPIFKLIIELAEKSNIPVIFNAIGIEGTHNKEDKQYKILKKSINKNIVKMCSTRDRIDVLKGYIDNPNIICEKVSDTGVWASEALNIVKDCNSNLIGLNVIEPSKFIDYNKNISEEELLIFWKNIIQELQNRNYNIKIFTNGMTADYEFALKIIKFCKLNEDILLKNPQNEYEMVKNISKFKAIIANRLHSCIAAYSLDIPAIGLAWNDKLLYWGKEIKLERRFFDFNEFNYMDIINEMENAIKEGYDQNYKTEFKRNIYDFLERSINFIK